MKVANHNLVIDREKVNSSTIKTLGHDERTKTLEVEFYHRKVKKQGAIWRYYPISLKAFKQLKAAKSIGSHFAHNIKGNILIIQQKVKDADK